MPRLPFPSSGAHNIVLATGNAGKVQEIRPLLTDLGLTVLTQAAFKIPEVEETGWTFIENALLKARHAARHTGLAAMADDSGLEVDALHGAPGLFSSRYAGRHASDEENIRKLLTDLAESGKDNRKARFRCVMVYLRHALDPAPLVGQGTWEGHILPAPRGSNGFGYDPVFQVPDHGCTAAELPPEIKQAVSHRGQALRALVRKLQAEMRLTER